MGMTLDEYLTEIDCWKQPVSDQTSKLSEVERAVFDREARAWLEDKLGRSLEVAPRNWEKKPVPS
jgi:hypothetical protein